MRSTLAVSRFRLPKAAAAAVALAIAGGALATAGTASATPIPLGRLGAPAYSGFGPASSMFSFGSMASTVNAQAANLLAAAGDPSGQDTSGCGGSSPWNATTNPWTSTNISGFSNCKNTHSPNGNNQIAADFLGKEVYNVPPTPGTYLAKLKATDPSYTFDAAQLRNLSNIFVTEPPLFIASRVPDNSTLYPGGLYSVNGDMTVSSRATVKKPGRPAAYSLTLATSGAAAAGSKAAGYVVPSGEVVTFPKGFVLNLAVLKDEIPYADINNPAAAGKKPIGTLKVKTPAAYAITLSMTSPYATGQVYLVRSQNPRQLVPELELWIPGAPSGGFAVQVMGKLSGTSFPMTVTFATPHFGPAVAFAADIPPLAAVPFSSLTVSFPAASSPYVVSSCKKVPAATAAVTDNLGAIAPYFGDYRDGNTSGLTGAVAPVKVAATRTKVVDACRRDKRH